MPAGVGYPETESPNNAIAKAIIKRQKKKKKKK